MDTASHYPASFYEEINQGSMRSAKIVLGILFDILPFPTSIVDVGCGEGAWLKVAQQLGVDQIRGIDGHHVDESRLLIDRNDFYHTDLSDPTILHEVFDWAISLEVAEHLPESSADQFIDILCDLAPTILFSAAIPGQGGVNHVNEQWPSYWIPKFKERGYMASDLIRRMVWNNPGVENWYKQNMIFFTKDHFLIKEMDNYWIDPIDCVHPQNWKDHYLDKR